jgi:hypothetical protein
MGHLTIEKLFLKETIATLISTDSRAKKKKIKAMGQNGAGFLYIIFSRISKDKIKLWIICRRPY